MNRQRMLPKCNGILEVRIQKPDFRALALLGRLTFEGYEAAYLTFLEILDSDF
jgi:hypothetical protein